MNEKQEKKKNDEQQVVYYPNKEWLCKPLNLGNVDMGLQQSRHQRNQRWKTSIDDKDVEPPSIYTHHNNAIKALDKINSTFEKNRLSPNITFDN